MPRSVNISGVRLYGVIALSLAMHAWKMVEKKTEEPPEELESLDVGQETPTEIKAV